METKEVISKAALNRPPRPENEGDGSVKRRLPMVVRLLLLAAPTIAVAVFLAVNYVLLPLRASIRKSEVFAAETPVAAQTSTVIHFLQIERGSSNGFLSSKGARFSEQMTGARKNVNEAVKELLTLVESCDDTDVLFKDRLSTFVSGLGRLEEHRKTIDALSLDEAGNVGFYSSMIAGGLAVPDSLQNLAPSPALAAKIGSYAALSRGKEAAGKERALLTAVLTKEAFTVSQFRLSSELAAAQKSCWDLYKSIAPSDLVGAFETLRAQPVWTAVEDQRLRAQAAFAGKIENADATKWFADATARIDALRQIEQTTKDQMVVAVGDYLAQERKNFRFVFSLSVGGLLVAILAVLWQARVINRSVTGVVRSISQQLVEQSAAVASAAREIDAASHALATGASQQAAALEETSATLEELSAQTKIYDDNTRAASQKIRVTRKAAELGDVDVNRLSSVMGELSQASDNVGKIVKTIDEIAFQTNLLALNAAVEAARAGDAGLGFAVVADEVRALAKRSAEAAKESAEKIEASITTSRQGVALGNDLKVHLSEIVAGVREVDSLVDQISSASHEQAQGLQQITTSVAEIDRLTQGNASSAEETASSSSILDQQADLLKVNVDHLMAAIGARS